METSGFHNIILSKTNTQNTFDIIVLQTAKTYMFHHFMWQSRKYHCILDKSFCILAGQYLKFMYKCLQRKLFAAKLIYVSVSRFPEQETMIFA